MRQVVYLVQLQPHFRFYYEIHTGRTLYLGAGAQAFTSRDQAESWMHNHLPIHFNPFAGFWEDESDVSLLSLAQDEEAVPTPEIISDFIRSLGLVPPRITPHNFYGEERWSNWWDTAVPDMTDAQKAAIWKFLAPTPYRLVEVVLDS